MTLKKRNQLLVQMTDEVADLVLNDNYQQALVMSFSAESSLQYEALYQNYIKELETSNVLNRKVEFLPTDRTLLERKTAGQGLTRPELAVLLAYTKIHLKSEILKSDLPEDPYFEHILETGFPSRLGKDYPEAMKAHRLHREIIATQLSNRVVNEMGITFVYRAQAETGSSVADIIRAQIVASEIFDAAELEKLVASLNFKVALKTQYELLHHFRTLLNLSARWFLRKKTLKNNMAPTIAHFTKNVKILEGMIPSLMVGTTQKYLQTLTTQFEQVGLPKETARHIAAYRAIYTSLNIIEVATQHRFDLIKTAKVYFVVGDYFKLVWFRDQIATDTREGHWNSLARLTLRDELDILQKSLTVTVMLYNKKEANIHSLIKQWRSDHRLAITRWEQIINMLHSSAGIDYSTFFISLRQLHDLIQVEEMV